MRRAFAGVDLAALDPSSTWNDGTDGGLERMATGAGLSFCQQDHADDLHG
jgi:hypothetical protein